VINNFVIKEAGIEDVPLLLSFIKKIAEYEKLSHEVIATEETLTESLFGKHKNVESFFVYKDEKPIAYAIYFYNFSTFIGRKGLYLEDVFVLPEYRNFGIGKLILNHLVQKAIKENCGRMEWSVLNWNKSAIEFYKKLGAKPLDEWTVFRLTEDKMKKLAERNNKTS
jgi:GNAT superfamily N-acetyltransferase